MTSTLQYFATRCAADLNLTVGEAVRALARDAGVRGADDLPLHRLESIIVTEHADGGLEIVD
jgi:hypothetical protein